MRKIITVVLLVISLVALSACGGKVADPIRLPKRADIQSIHITHNNQTFEQTDQAWISELLNKLDAGNPTTIESVQDQPNVEDYIKIEIPLRDGSNNTFYIYQERNTWYIEQPYQGIYKTDASLIDFIDTLK